MTKKCYSKKQKKACRSRGQTEVASYGLVGMRRLWSRIARDVQQGRIEVEGMARGVVPAMTAKSALILSTLGMLGMPNSQIRRKGDR